MSMKPFRFRLDIALRIGIAALLCHFGIATTLAQGSIRADIFEQLEKAQAAQNSGDIQQTFKILDALKADDSVKIAGFGTYKVAKRKARVGRNPRTGEQIQIAASQKVKFLPAKALKEVFNK